MPRTVFDVPALNARQQDLEQLAAQPDFWDDQQNAQKQMRRLDEVKAQLAQLAGWRGAVDDAQATLELYELEPDDDLLQEAQNGLNQLRQGLDRWELERLLSGEYDKEGAVLSINAGAGGTDAQDWAQMLLRVAAALIWPWPERWRRHRWWPNISCRCSIPTVKPCSTEVAGAAMTNKPSSKRSRR